MKISTLIALSLGSILGLPRSSVWEECDKNISLSPANNSYEED